MTTAASEPGRGGDGRLFFGDPGNRNPAVPPSGRLDNASGASTPGTATTIPFFQPVAWILDDAAR
jgi:hypothetical protein